MRSNGSQCVVLTSDQGNEGMTVRPTDCIGSLIAKHKHFNSVSM